MKLKTCFIAVLSLLLLMSCNEDDELNQQENECKITEGISPNQDEINDNFDLSCLADRTGIANLEIFDRNGILVYEKANYRDEFVGQNNDGDELVTGTYFYVITFEAEDSEYGTETSGSLYINVQQ